MIGFGRVHMRVAGGMQACFCCFPLWLYVVIETVWGLCVVLSDLIACKNRIQSHDLNTYGRRNQDELDRIEVEPAELKVGDVDLKAVGLSISALYPSYRYLISQIY